MRVSPHEGDSPPSGPLHIFEPVAGDERLIGLSIRHEVEGASYVAITAAGSLAALAVIAQGPPPQFPPSPFDEYSFIRANFADTDARGVALLRHVRAVTQGRVCVYVNLSEASEIQKLRRASYRLCGVASGGWRIMTGVPDARDGK